MRLKFPVKYGLHDVGFEFVDILKISITNMNIIFFKSICIVIKRMLNVPHFVENSKEYR